MLSQSCYRIEERSQIGTVRRGAAQMAASLGFDEVQSGKLGIAVAESSTNILKHAGHGQLLLRALRSGETNGIEVIALDKGPGISNVAASLRDGHSTSGSMGTGLGALSRLSESFQIFTQPGRGMALRVELWAKSLPQRPPAIEYGGLCIAKRSEPVPGDAWGVAEQPDHFTVLLADGLGHGVDARRAAIAATQVLAAQPMNEPLAIVQECHVALAPTRGAAVAVAKVLRSANRGTFAGVGNIVCRVEGSEANRSLMSYNGTVGHTLRKVQEMAFAWPVGALLILHSDGLGTQWDLTSYPGLASRHPALIAAVLYRDYDRGRDDVCVVVLRNRGAAGKQRCET